MKPIPPRPSDPPPRRDSFLIYMPGGIPVLRAAVEELLKTSWDEAFRQRAIEIGLAFEGSFKVSDREDLAAVVRSLLRLLELEASGAALLGSALALHLHELLGQLEAAVESEEQRGTG